MDDVVYAATLLASVNTPAPPPPDDAAIVTAPLAPDVIVTLEPAIR